MRAALSVQMAWELFRKLRTDARAEAIAAAERAARTPGSAPEPISCLAWSVERCAATDAETARLPLANVVVQPRDGAPLPGVAAAAAEGARVPLLAAAGAASGDGSRSDDVGGGGGADRGTTPTAISTAGPAVAAADATAATVTVASASAPPPPQKPTGATVMADRRARRAGRTYYFNAVQGYATWFEPAVVRLLGQLPRRVSGICFYDHERTLMCMRTCGRYELADRRAHACCRWRRIAC